MTTRNGIYITNTDTADTITIYDSTAGNTYAGNTAGNIYYDTSDTTWHYYDNTHWIAPNTVPITWDLPPDRKLDDIFRTVKCMCCNVMIKDKDNGLHIKLGEKTFWFHRRCFSDKRNSKFIRSLIVSEDLGLL